MVVLNKKAFKLPRVEKEKFVFLMHLGSDYDRDRGTFSIKSYNNIEKLTDLIASILGTEVIFLQSCTRCGKDFSCGDCTYNELCATRNLPFSCVCPQCLRDRKHFEQYLEKF